ncbi:MAG TPA: helix-turn-helix domain-containing protein [Urbifossiella sp.]|nr:helix-turn-helix domain-containing protein [Urbifossiella sp.]
MVFRCRIVLIAAQPEQPTNQQVANALDCNRHTVGQWRERYVVHGLTGLQDAPRSGRPRSFSPSERLHVITLASRTTEEHQQPDTSWGLDNLALEILRDAHHRDMSRSTIGRILAEVDLKPHRSQYWLNSHDPDFDAKAKHIC